MLWGSSDIVLHVLHQLLWKCPCPQEPLHFIIPRESKILPAVWVVFPQTPHLRPLWIHRIRMLYMIFCQVLGRVSVIFIALLFKLMKANISMTKPLLDLLKKYYGSMPRSTDKKAFKRGLELWAKWQHIQIDVYLLVTCWMSDAIATVGTASGLRDTLPPEWSKQSSVKCLEHRTDVWVRDHGSRLV